MIADAVSKRYAKALVGVAADNQELEDQTRRLNTVLATINSSGELKEFLFNPAVNREHKKSALSLLLERLSLPKGLKSFLLLLVEKNRIENLENIIRWHQALVDERMNRAHAKVTCAQPLSEDERRALLRRLSEITKKQITLEEQVDPQLIAGVVAQIGSTIYDGSLRRQLALIKADLLKE